MSLLLIAKCIDCHVKMECPNIYSRSRLKRCTSCSNKQKYQNRKILLKAKRLKLKRCHFCGGMNQSEGVWCSNYCSWANMVRRNSHGKSVVRIDELV